MGVLGIPVGAYLDLAAALEQEKPAQRQMVEVLLPFLIPYSTAIRRRMEDEFHWERLAFLFLPAEPDVLGVLFCVEATLRARKQESLLGMIRELPLSEFATEILYNAILQRFGDRTVGGEKPEGGKPQLRFR